MVAKTTRSNLVLITGVLIAVFFYPLAGHLLFSQLGYTFANALYSRLLIWLDVLILYLYALNIEQNRLLLWAERKRGAGFYLASFVVLYLLSMAAGVASRVPDLFGFRDDRSILVRMIAVFNQNAFLAIFTAVTAGITEELIFRGYLLPRLEILFKNKYMPVIVSSLAFGLMHYKYRSYHEVIFATLFGVIFSIHYLRYRNIWILMLTHMSIDMVSLFVYRMAAQHHLPVK
ncbi:MAG TPA: type II CAAX endopeptidase family protein [Mucilaginibacter sp.]|nr:type II CAAX endopeptidase family protein [Mucilaginibacter sp.]